MTASHLIAHGDLARLGNVDPYGLVHAGSQLVAVLSCEYLGVHADAVSAVGHLKGGVADLSCLLAEDGAEELFFCGQLSLSLGSYLTYQDIAGTDLCADADDAALVQIL